MLVNIDVSRPTEKYSVDLGHAMSQIKIMGKDVQIKEHASKNPIVLSFEIKNSTRVEIAIHPLIHHSIHPLD